MIEEADLQLVVDEDAETLPLPDGWRVTHSGRPMPDVVAAIRRSRRGH